MKTAELSSTAAFSDPKQPPTADMMKLALGNEAYGNWQELIAWLEKEFPALDLGWKYGGSVGWYAVPAFKKRRICYFLPRRGDFELRMILGDRALATLEKGPHARTIDELRSTADRYPEGTSFAFTSHTWHDEVVFALLEAKMRT